jgi:phosphomannomutase
VTDLDAQVAAWLAADPDPATRAELEAMSTEERAARFSGHLAFGTAGLRGPLGAGPTAMNRVVVRSAAAGLTDWLQAEGRAPVVVVGCDARRNSDVFAADTAAVVEQAGGRALRLPPLLPTPLLAFAVRDTAADAGVMVTASHNPPGDNGYKVYLGDGAQLVPPADAEIEAAIRRAGLQPRDLPPVGGAPVEGGIVARYLDAVVPDGPDLSGLRVVYTPLHGVGLQVLAPALARRGAAPIVVPSQAEPDGAFPTVAFPNPEEPGALDLALALASERGADVLLANDPDADRLGVAVPDRSGAWRVLSGDELGVLLADHVLATTTGPDRLVATTIVSSSMLSSMAAAAGVRYVETLTGFKWIVRPALDDPSLRFVFGYEEALGYAVNDVVRDKDGISAAVVLLDAMVRLGGSGPDLLRRLEELAAVHGRHRTAGVSIRFEGVDAPARMGAVLARLRTAPPSSIGGERVADVVDYLPGGALAPTDAIRFDLAAGGRVLVRPSGTEPKVKVYLELVGDVADDVALTARLEALRSAVPELLGP